MSRVCIPMFICLLILGGAVYAGERVDLIPDSEQESSESNSKYILDAGWICADPFGEFDSSLGAAAALNRTLALIFSGHASETQIQLQRDMVEKQDGSASQWAPFAVSVLDEMQKRLGTSFPEPIELRPFDLTPSEMPEVLPDNPNLIAIRYDDEEYLERLLQRLYFKLIQGPVLLTVPYCGHDERVPEEYRDWNNFRYASNDNVMEWDDVRLVWIDWDLTQTVVLTYENGLIACYDSGKKYHIDHTAAITAAGAILAHPDFDEITDDGSVHFVLTAIESE